MNAEASDDIDRAKFWLTKALACFERGEAQDLESMIKLHLESLEFREEIEKGLDVQDQDDTEKLLKRSEELLVPLLESGLKLEAAKVCY